MYVGHGIIVACRDGVAAMLHCCARKAGGFCSAGAKHAASVALRTSACFDLSIGTIARNLVQRLNRRLHGNPDVFHRV
jgi:hypothetical protein